MDTGSNGGHGVTGAEAIAMSVLGCGILDIAIFDRMAESGLVGDAADELREDEIGISAGTLWEYSIRLAWYRCGGDWNEVRTYFDFIGSCVAIDGEAMGRYRDFEGMTRRFREMTGYEMDAW